MIELALTADVDGFLTGEASEQTVHIAREQGIHFFAAGHHATERYGIPALGAHLAAQYPLRFTFVDIDNLGVPPRGGATDSVLLPRPAHDVRRAQGT